MTRSLESDFIPKSFRLKNSLPGNTVVNQSRIDTISKNAIEDDKKMQKEQNEKVKAELKMCFHSAET